MTRGKLFFVGKIVDVARELKGGFVRGHANLLGLDQWTGSEARIAIQNENLVLWIDGVPAIMVPDLIMNLELDTGEPITTEMLRYGQRVAVIGMPVHELMRTPKALEVVGPQAFGYPELTLRAARSTAMIATTLVLVKHALPVLDLVEAGEGMAVGRGRRTAGETARGAPSRVRAAAPDCEPGTESDEDGRAGRRGTGPSKFVGRGFAGVRPTATTAAIEG